MSGQEHPRLDGAYVLGTLGAAERQEFERHLATCTDCSRDVREIAGLPGLLARLEASEVVALDHQEPLPAGLLPSLLDRVRRRRVVRRAWVAGGGLVAAAALVVATLLLTQDPPPAPVPEAIGASEAMTPVAQDRLTADLQLRGVAWGTRLRVLCTYRGTTTSAAAMPAYALVVHRRSGGTEQVATWRPVAGRTTTIDAATASRAGDIDRVEVSTTDGLLLLRLDR